MFTQQSNTPIKEILIEENLATSAYSLIGNIGLKKKNILLISDQNIYPTLGKKIIDSFDKKQISQLILDSPKADYKTVLEIVAQAKDFNLIIGAGSGTINDLCKLSSYKLKIPYVIFGSAPSMNGYASANASISLESHKTSLSAHLPEAIYLDLDILSETPERLIRSGIGDSMCFSTCQFDWLLSHLILGTPYNSKPFDILRPYYLELLEYQGSIKDKKFIKLLAKNLIISGIGMYICGGSYPASQSEHLIAHYIEIQYPQITKESFHGEQIAVTTMSIANLHDQLLKMKELQIFGSEVSNNYLLGIFQKDLANHFFHEIRKKFINKNLESKINQNLKENWLEIKKKLSAVYISKDQLKKYSKKFNLTQRPEEIGISNSIYQEATNRAYMIRNRFTILDLKNLY